MTTGVDVQVIDGSWTICPAGGIDKIQPFVSLFSGQHLDIAVLSDFAVGDRKKFDALRQKQILENDRLLTFATLLGKEEGDAEDVFADAVYLHMVNASSGVPAGKEITPKQLSAEGGETSRLLKKVEACMRLMPPETPEFNHYVPAAWLFQHPEILDGDSEDVLETLNRAETVIKALNKLLSNWDDIPFGIREPPIWSLVTAGAMTYQARQVLDDCRVALSFLEEEHDLQRWRVHWAAAVALLRAVGHVLDKVDDLIS